MVLYFIYLYTIGHYTHRSLHGRKVWTSLCMVLYFIYLYTIGHYTHRSLHGRKVWTSLCMVLYFIYLYTIGHYTHRSLHGRKVWTSLCMVDPRCLPNGLWLGGKWQLYGQKSQDRWARSKWRSTSFWRMYQYMYINITFLRGNIVDCHPEETLSTEVEPRLTMLYEGWQCTMSPHKECYIYFIIPNVAFLQQISPPWDNAMWHSKLSPGQLTNHIAWN